MSAGSFNDALRPSDDLNQLAPLFREAVLAAVAECQRKGYDAMIYEAYRSQQLQAQYYARGRSVIPPTSTVTNAPTNLHSWHGYGLAVDVISRSKGWDAGDAWFSAVADIFKQHDCKWGGDWRERDVPHFQWHRCKASPSDEARKLVATVGIPAVWQAVGAVANEVTIAAVHDDARVAVVTASSLNLRADPSTSRPPLRVLERGTRLEVLEARGSWLAVRVDGATGFVHGDMVALTDHTARRGFLSADGDLRAAPLEARQQLPAVTDNAIRQNVVRTWNRYGGLLSPLSKAIGVEAACGVAVLCVESGGAGFLNGKLVIRFEAHVFHRLWGKSHTSEFERHFRFNADKRWTGHEFSDGVSPFAPYHENQAKEWRAFDVACQLDKDAAIQSISMGAPQIMGFNYDALGYASPEEMFERFSSDERFHVLGLFDFIKGPSSTSAMVLALQQGNYEAFATRYNGSGQAAVYGARMRAHVEALHSVMQPA